MVLFAKLGKSFKRDAQGALARRLTEEAFKDEISELYRMVDQGPAATHCSAAEMALDLKERVRAAVSSVFQLDDIAADQDVFRLPGADSLRISGLSHILSKQIGTRISARQLYQHSTIQRLAQALIPILYNKDRGRSAALAAQNGPYPVVGISREQQMSVMIHESIQSVISSLNGETRLPLPPGKQPRGIPGKYTVLLVGSTGLLGSHLLDALLRQRRVECIWCLNQSVGAAQEQEQLFLRLRFDTRDELTGDRVEFVTSLNLGAYHLGICEELRYADLAESIDVIIYNAWPASSTLPLPFFADSIKGVVALAGLAVRSGSTMVFLSSVASCMNYAAIRRHPSGAGPNVVVPERFEPDHSMPARQGYGESKHVAESILAAVAKRYAVRTLILRVRHLAGTTCGRHGWNKNGKFGHTHSREKTAANP
jgi:nucleoside-diphosphate-sugar epimerase/acyl carrier protein